MMAPDLDTKAIIAKVNREDLWREAAKTIGVAANDMPAGTSRGKETFFDGKVFDPADPKAYLAALRSRRWRDAAVAKAGRARSAAAVAAFRRRSAEIVTFRPPVRPALQRAMEIARHVASVVLPPLIVLSLTLFVWQLLCSEPGARLPPPTKVVADAWDFIADPFYDNGGIDKGAFWQISKSLGAWRIGFSLAAVVGIALGVLVGQSTWAMRGLDPIFQVLRTVPPLACSCRCRWRASAMPIPRRCS